MTKNAAKIVTDAILGRELRVVSVAGKAYTITPPTIYRLAGAANSLAHIAEAKTIADVLAQQTELLSLATALSWFIQGDDSLSVPLAQGTMTEVVNALKICYDLVSVQDFLTLLILARNVARLAANQKR